MADSGGVMLMAAPQPPPLFTKKLDRTVSKRFAFDQSTEDHFACADCKNYGAYGYLRDKIDYTYHSRYEKKRQWLHDSIIEEILSTGDDQSSAATNADPWLIFTVGAQGAGKRYTMEKLFEDERILLHSYVTVDPDEIRRMLPEYSYFNSKNQPEAADRMTRRECGYIAETLAGAALEQGRHVIFDCYMQDPTWYVRLLQCLRQRYEMLKFGLIHVQAQTEIVLERARQKGQETGRMIPEEKLLKMLERIPESLQVISPMVDAFFSIRNDGGELQIEGGADWVEFTSTFLEVCSRTKGDHATAARQNARPGHRRAGRTSLRRFSALMSSEDNHKADDMKMYGQFAYIRETLDYNYHSNYTFRRQMFQDAIIGDYLNGAIVHDKNGEVCTTPTEPWIVFTAGAMGAGKSYTMHRLVKAGRFPLMAFVDVDPDAIRRHLPEFHLYVDTCPVMAGQLTNKESGYVAEILALAGLHAGKNVLVDGSLRDAEWYKGYFARLRKEFPHIRIAIIHVTAPREAVFQRAAERAEATGRIVPQDVLEKALDQVPRSVGILKELVDYHVELYNAPNVPDIELVTAGETWENFQSQWIQTCAWVPSKRYMQKLSSSADSQSSAVS